MDRRAQNIKISVPVRNLLAAQGFENQQVAAAVAQAAAADDNVGRSRCYMCDRRGQTRVRSLLVSNLSAKTTVNLL